MTDVTAGRTDRAATRQRVLDPLERALEVLFGLIMVLTFTGSISVAEAGREEIRTILAGALGCNLAWGLVDAVMYLMSSFIARGRELVTLKAVRGAQDPQTAHQLIDAALPSFVSSVMTPSEFESLRLHLVQQPEGAGEWRLTMSDLKGAAGVFLLVFLSTFPVVVPFIVMRDAYPALRTSNAIAVVMLFLIGSSLGRYGGRSGWRIGVGMVVLGLLLVGITMALGG